MTTLYEVKALLHPDGSVYTKAKKYVPLKTEDMYNRGFLI
jgi:hypothetical protein